MISGLLDFHVRSLRPRRRRSCRCIRRQAVSSIASRDSIEVGEGGTKSGSESNSQYAQRWTWLAGQESWHSVGGMETENLFQDCTLLLLVCAHVKWAVIICGLGELTLDMVKSCPNYFATMDVGKQGWASSETRLKEKPPRQDSEYITKLMRAANSSFFCNLFL